MGEQDLKQRTKEFVLRVIRVVEALPKGKTADVLGRQLLRCGTSVGAIDFQIIDFIPLSAGPEGEIRVKRTCGYVVEDFDR